MPTCVILTLHVRQGHLPANECRFLLMHGCTYVSQYKIDPSLIRSRPASNRAFSSACMHRQVDRPTPAADPVLQRRPFGVSLFIIRLAHVHPPSLQFLRFLGVPLYPVLITRCSRTKTHPTRRFMQLLRWAASDASCMKYSSQLGLNRCPFVRSRPLSASYRRSLEDV